MEQPKVKQIQWFDSRFYLVEWKDESGEHKEFFPSTTTKLGVISKPFLARWRGDITNREADMRLWEAQQSGTRIHNAWDIMGRGGRILYQPFGKPNFTLEEMQDHIKESEMTGGYAVLQYQDEMYDIYKLQKWHEIVKPKIIHSEMTLYSLKYKEAGTADKVMLIEAGEYLINGKKPVVIETTGNYIVDLKTGNNVDDDAEMQIADYGMMYEEMGLGEIAGGLIIHTGSKVKNGIDGLSTILRTKEEMTQDFQNFRKIADAWQVNRGDMTPKVFEFPSLIQLKEIV